MHLNLASLSPLLLTEYSVSNNGDRLARFKVVIGDKYINLNKITKI